LPRGSGSCRGEHFDHSSARRGARSGNASGSSCKARKPLALFGSVAALSPAPEPAKSTAALNGLTVKRFVVTTGIEAREPLIGAAPLLAGEDPIFAFAELGNHGDEQQVSVTFERKGSTVRVGHASLKVPANVPRHRTWANTRYIREPGTWEAVLSNANGEELARTAFEVAAK
jgi:hypothetical protein